MAFARHRAERVECSHVYGCKQRLIREGFSPLVLDLLSLLSPGNAKQNRCHTGGFGMAFRYSCHCLSDDLA